MITLFIRHYLRARFHPPLVQKPHLVTPKLLFKSIAAPAPADLANSTFDPVTISNLLLNSREADWNDETLRSLIQSSSSTDIQQQQLLTESLVEKILLHFREPTNAKKALSFFHCSSRIRKSPHALRSYCLLVHILVRAGLLTDATALLQSSINNNTNNNLIVVETLLATYDLAPPGPQVFNLLLQAYAKLRMVELAFDSLCYLETQPDHHGFCQSLASSNAMLRGASKSGKTELAWKLYEYMLDKRVYPNETTVQIMTDVMCKEGALTKTLSVMDRIHTTRCAPPPGSVVNLRLACRISEEGRIEQGSILLKRLLQKNLVLDSVVNSLVIYGNCKTGRLDLAYGLYNDMMKRGYSSNAFIHTSFIGAHCKEGRLEEALQLMEEMVCVGLKPYDETYSFLIEGCSRTGRLDISLDLYEKMLKERFVPGTSACNEMLGMLCTKGEVDRANEVLTTMIEKGFVPEEGTYSKLIGGYGKIGNAQGILKLKYEMEYKGVAMGVMVYACLIRNLCRCGKLVEAEKVLSSMEVKSLPPNGAMYDAMIVSYCINGTPEKAVYFYDEMMRKKLKPCAQTLTVLVRSVINVDSIECYREMLDIL